MIITDAVTAEYLRLRAHRLTAAAPLTAYTRVAHRLAQPLGPGRGQHRAAAAAGVAK